MITVVIPVRNAADTLGACLEALARQTVASSSYEVIVVNDGSTDNTRQLALAHAVCCLDIAPAGPAAARNHGVGQARGELVLFTDGDCVPAPDWIEQMSAPFVDLEVVGARGVYRTRQTGLIARFVQQEYQDKYDRTARRATIDFIDTYSAGYRRSVFQDNGGFEPAFSAPSVEDQEFSFRLAQKGYKLVFAPRAIVYHRHDHTLADYARRKYSIGYWKAFLLRWHPEKALGDSHTPLSQRAQMGLVGLAGTAAVLGLAWHALWWGAAVLLAVFLITAVPFFHKLWQRDRPVLLIAPLMLFVRAVALSVGLAAGFFGLRVQPAPRQAVMAWPVQMAKRLMDIIGAAGALILAGPVLAGLVIFIKLHSPGPAFEVQERVGENGRRFRLFKLRTRAPTLDVSAAGNSAPTTNGDPRVTRLGRILRRWSLDDLPLFWNVLKGDMSLVGPRPEQPAVLAEYRDWHRARLAVRPGLTGPTQINRQVDLALDDRIRLELDYIEHDSLGRDLKILLESIPAVIRGRGAD